MEYLKTIIFFYQKNKKNEDLPQRYLDFTKKYKLLKTFKYFSLLYLPKHISKNN